jgi:Dolichyl-phosphate-mannose-protein mannosyltransferase
LAGLLLPGLFVALGVVLRIWEFGADFSLNHDDICLALNVLNRSARDLTRTLDFDQAAPLGFLWAERFVVSVSGGGERALRLLPLIAGVLAVVAFWLLADRILPRFEAIVATGFFAMSQALIGTSVQVKPYAIDVLVTIVMTQAGLYLMRPNPDPVWVGVAAFLGAASVWVSFPVMFVMTGMGIVIAVKALRRGIRQGLYILPAFLAWTTSIVLAYFFSVRPGLLNDRLARLDAYAEFPIHEPRAIYGWVITSLQNMGSICSSVRLAPLMAGAFVVSGCAVAVRRGQTSLLLAAPIFVCFVASVAQKYPWLPRLLFFMVSLILLLTALECGSLANEIGVYARRAASILAAGALAYATLSAVKNVAFGDPGFDDPRGAVTSIVTRWHPGDHLYASGAGLPPVLYYGLRQGRFSSPLNFVSPRIPAYVPGRPERLVGLPSSKGRLWFLFFVPDEAGYDRMVLEYFKQDALPIDRTCFKHYVVSLWLLSDTRAGDSTRSSPPYRSGPRPGWTSACDDRGN